MVGVAPQPANVAHLNHTLEENYVTYAVPAFVVILIIAIASRRRHRRGPR
jgi:hypothetical protein